jgi:hypothetical protein
MTWRLVTDHIVIDHFLTSEESPVWGALDALATEGVTIAQQLCPVGNGYEDVPGELRDSIIKVLGVKKSGKPIAFVGSTKPYASYVELGTAKMDAQPYLRPMLMRLDAQRAFGGLVAP